MSRASNQIECPNCGHDIDVNEILYDQVDEQLKRKPYPLPQMKLNSDIDDILKFKYEDFELINYQSHPKISAPIAV